MPCLHPAFPAGPPRPTPPICLSPLLAPAPPPICLPTSLSRLPVRLTCLHAPSQPAHLTLPPSCTPVPSRVVIAASHGKRDDRKRRRVRRRKEESREIRTKNHRRCTRCPPVPSRVAIAACVGHVLSRTACCRTPRKKRQPDKKKSKKKKRGKQKEQK